MISIEKNKSHLVDHDEFAQWMHPQTPVDDNGKAALIWAVDVEHADGVVTYKVTLSPFVDMRALSPHIRANIPPKTSSISTIARAPRIVVSYDDSVEGVELNVAGYRLPLTPQRAEYNGFNNKNSALLFAPVAHIDVVHDWLRYTVKKQDLQAAVIVLQIRPDLSPKLARQVNADVEEFSRTIEDEGLLETASINITDLPLGRVGEANIREPYMAPDAPNKIKMEKPPNDAWQSEFGTAVMHELMRERYLGDAVAVLHLTPYDLLERHGDRTVFDAVKTSDEGYIQIFGTKTYTWRIREKAVTGFGDHIVSNIEDRDKNRGWIVVPQGKRKGQIWNPFRVGAPGENTHPEFHFWRAMALRHDLGEPNTNLAPRGALVRDDALVAFMAEHFPADPVFPPEVKPLKIETKSQTGRRVIVTTMKNEGPFILEWIAYHRAIGFNDFLVYTNDCVDGTDTMHDLLQEAGVVVHKDNPYRETGLKPQHAAIFDAEQQEMFQDADWVICMDVDEFVNIHIGDGHLDDLFDAVGDANMISIAWRLFGNGDVEAFEDRPIIEQFNQCAPELMRSPHQAWGVKTLYRNLGLFRKMGVHRPKGVVPEFRDHIKWVNGSGDVLPDKFIRNAWRVSLSTYGYDLVTLNHYAIRSAESFVVKRDRGRVNHVNRDQGLNYWFRMNHNIEVDDRIKAMIPKMEAERAKLLALPGVRKQHEASVQAHRDKIAELLASEKYRQFYADINSERMRRLSRISPRFGMNVFVAGPEVVGDDVIHALESDATKYYNVRLPDGG